VDEVSRDDLGRRCVARTYLTSEQASVYTSWRTPRRFDSSSPP